MIESKSNKHKGHGGLDCPCCRPLLSKQKSKRFIAKYNRRHALDDIKELENKDEDMS